MLKTKILLMSSMSPAAAWAASANMGPSLLIIQVIGAIAVSFSLFMAILRFTDSGDTPSATSSQRIFEPRRRRFSAIR